MEGDRTVAEPYADEAKFFSEAKLLHRDVKIILEGTSNQNLLGTVLHPVSGDTPSVSADHAAHGHSHHGGIVQFINYYFSQQLFI